MIPFISSCGFNKWCFSFYKKDNNEEVSNNPRNSVSSLLFIIFDAGVLLKRLNDERFVHSCIKTSKLVLCRKYICIIFVD